MGIKEELIKLKNKSTRREKAERFSDRKKVIKDVSQFREGNNSPTDKAIADHFDEIRNILLDTKVEDYIKWNFENMVKGRYTDIGEYWKPIDLRNFIEKMAVWYELRYPSYEINRLMPGSSQEGIEINDIMFNSNIYINDLFDKDSDVRVIDWDEFYNTHAFIKSLPWEEKYRFQNVKYRGLVYLDKKYTSYDDLGLIKTSRVTPHLHLSPNGFVELAEEIDSYSNYKVTNEQLKGMHAKDVVKLLKEKGITLPSDNELQTEINNVEKWIQQKEGLLDAVMYRIIERGGNRIGPRRGFLFAKEFGRNIDISMMYGVDRTDPGLRLFINEYIKAGGSKDLMCYVGYFSRTNKTKKIDTISIQDLILIQNNNAATFYTSEETTLHQRIVNILSNRVENEEAEQNDSIEKKSGKKLVRKITPTNK